MTNQMKNLNTGVHVVIFKVRSYNESIENHKQEIFGQTYLLEIFRNEIPWDFFCLLCINKLIIAHILHIHSIYMNESCIL